MERDGDLMSEQHQWSHIWKGAIPASLAVIIIFANMTSRWKWVLLIVAMAAAYGIVYVKSRKKADLFTAAALVFLVGVGMEFLQKAGIV